MRFLVIGGLAINCYGYSRDTADIDIFISHNDRNEWLGILSSTGYTIYHDGVVFIQFTPPEKNAWPVDLMLVQQQTFDPMYESSREVELLGVVSRVPLLKHLLALKIHALKNTRMHRFLKDFLDVENLIVINKLDINSADIRELFVKYGTSELYEKVSRSITAG